MATRNEVYLEFGRIAELAQLFETELGTALLAHDAMERKLYIGPPKDATARVLEAIESKTLGANLKAIRSRLDVSDDLAAVFEQALEARNALMHGFFLKHGMAIHSEAGCDAMIQHINKLRPDLERAYQSASYLSQVLVDAVRLLKRVAEQ